MHSCERTRWKSRDELGRVEYEGHSLEERLKGPTGGEVDVDATSRLTDACTDFEQLSAQSFDLSGSQRHGQLQTKQVD